MLRRLATAAACALAMTLAGPALAHADGRGFIEVRGDVWSMDDPEAGQHTRVPNRRQGDIRRTFFTHTDRQFVIRTKFAQLNRTGNLIFLATKLRTNTGLARDVALTASPRKLTDRWRGIVDVTRRNDTVVRCATRHSINYARNVVRVRIPRSCLGNPRSVRATHGVLTVQGQAEFTDNPFNRRATVHLPRFTVPIPH